MHIAQRIWEFCTEAKRLKEDPKLNLEDLSRIPTNLPPEEMNEDFPTDEDLDTFDSFINYWAEQKFHQTLASLSPENLKYLFNKHGPILALFLAKEKKVKDIIDRSKLSLADEKFVMLLEQKINNRNISEFLHSWQMSPSRSSFLNYKARTPREIDTLIVLTRVTFGTLGDYYAAEKIIRKIKEDYPSLKIQWIVSNPDRSYLPAGADNITDSFITISAWEELEELETVRFKHAALVFHFPAFHEMSEQTKRIITERIPSRTKIFSCLEYDYVPGNSLIQAGLGESSWGIFIDEPKSQSVSSILEELESTQVGYYLLKDTTPQTYSASHLCFFAYFNSNDSLAFNQRVVNPQTFCDIVLLYTTQKGTLQKNIDIICRISLEEVTNMDFSRIFNEAKVNRIVFTIDGQKKIIENLHPTPEGRTVRIYSAFPFSYNEFIQLIHLAYQSAVEEGLTPFIGCTGDQSFSEVLSLCIPFYQVMAWKSLLFKRFRALCEEVVGAQSLIGKFLDLTHPPSKNPDITAIIDLLHDPEMQKEHSRIHEFIFSRKNLSINLPINLMSMIFNQYPHMIEEVRWKEEIENATKPKESHQVMEV
jgi:hypothetical protein